MYPLNANTSADKLKAVNIDGFAVKLTKPSDPVIENTDITVADS